MISRICSIVSAILVFAVVNVASAQQSSETPSRTAAPAPAGGLFRLSEGMQAAADLRKAAEAMERFGKSMDRIADTVAEALARVSSEFDPFGYKTAFRTIGQQSEIIQKQHEIIRELLEKENRRLRSENEALKKQLQREQQRELQRGHPK